jgi:hypothetical protein
MKLLTKALHDKLLRNGRVQLAGKKVASFKPVVKFFTPDAQCTWLITELDQDGDTMFGLCDLGMGEPELGYVSLAELQNVRGKLGLPIERDKWFKAQFSISEYAEQSRRSGRVSA